MPAAVTTALTSERVLGRGQADVIGCRCQGSAHGVVSVLRGQREGMLFKGPAMLLLLCIFQGK